MNPPGNPIFLVSETHGRALRPENRVMAHSPDAGWRSLYAVMMEEAPFESTEEGMGHPSLIYHISQPTLVTRQIEGSAVERGTIGPRSITLSPGRPAIRWAHNGRPEMLQVYVRWNLFADAAQELFRGDPAKVEILPRFAIADPLLEQLALAIGRALRNGDSNDGLYVDALAQMIAVHLAKAHSTASVTAANKAPEQLANWKMRRLQDFIEHNLDRDLSLSNLARQVSISPLSLPRAFKSAFGQSPHQYVLSRRLERAKALLRNADLSVVDISLATGFSSQSHLSNWFTRTVGVSPAVYRKRASGA